MRPWSWPSRPAVAWEWLSAPDRRGRWDGRASRWRRSAAGGESARPASAWSGGCRRSRRSRWRPYERLAQRARVGRLGPLTWTWELHPASTGTALRLAGRSHLRPAGRGRCRTISWRNSVPHWAARGRRCRSRPSLSRCASESWPAGSGVSPDTIRFTGARVGCHSPTARDNNYREYDKAEVEHLGLLIDLRRMDVPLDVAAQIAAGATRAIARTTKARSSAGHRHPPAGSGDAHRWAAGIGRSVGRPGSPSRRWTSRT